MLNKINRYLNLAGISIEKQVNSGVDVYESFESDSLRNRRFYNIGSGSFSHPYWTNIDYKTSYYERSQKTEFINFDLMSLKPLPIDSSSAEIVYSSHVIEHITDVAVKNMLREAYRILKPGGCLRVCTPNITLAYDAYMNNDRSFFYWINAHSKPKICRKHYKIPPQNASIEQLFLHYFAGQLTEIDIDENVEKKFTDSEIVDIISNATMEDALDLFTKHCVFKGEYAGNHINWWSPEKLIGFFQKAGFSNTYISGFGQSSIPPLRDTTLFDSTHPKISLYLEATK